MQSIATNLAYHLSRSMSRTGCQTTVVLSVLFFIGLIAGSLALLGVELEAGWPTFVAAFLMAALPVPFYVAISTWVDRLEPEPPWLLAMAFFWGATTAILLAMIFNGVGEAVFTAFVGREAGSLLTKVLTAPFVEETAKGAALLMLFVWKRDEFDNVTDGIIYAAMVGLGFAMMENVQYYATAAAAGGSEAMGVFFVRGVLGPFAHPLFTSMTGIGLGVAQESDRKGVRFFAPLLGLGGAMLLHGLWNLGTASGPAFFAAYFLIMVPAFFAVITVAIFSLRRESAIIRKHLDRVVADRLLSQDDVLVVASVRRRIGMSAGALVQGGFGKWMARRRFHALATELAFHSWRTSRFPVEDAEAIRGKLVDRLRMTRAQLGLPIEIQPPDPARVGPGRP